MTVDPTRNVYLAHNSTVTKLGTDGRTQIYAPHRPDGHRGDRGGAERSIPRPIRRRLAPSRQSSAPALAPLTRPNRMAPLWRLPSHSPPSALKSSCRTTHSSELPRVTQCVI